MSIFFSNYNNPYSLIDNRINLNPLRLTMNYLCVNTPTCIWNNFNPDYTNLPFTQQFPNFNPNYTNLPFTQQFPNFEPYFQMKNFKFAAPSFNFMMPNFNFTTQGSNIATQSPTVTKTHNSTTTDKSDINTKTNSTQTKPKTNGTLFDSNTKLKITKVRKGSMPYLLIGPENVDPNEKLPTLVYLHGIHQKGTDPDQLQKYNYDPAVIMKDWDLKNFKGYILCPQLPDGTNWCNKNIETKLRNVLTEFQSDHNVDKDNISLIGFSLGGAGALYMANEMSDVFKKAVSLSPYNPGNLTSKMKIPTKAFAGTNDDNRNAGCPVAMTQGRLKNILGEENCKMLKGKRHGDVPPTVFTMDEDKNGCSDIIEWLFS